MDIHTIVANKTFLTEQNVKDFVLYVLDNDLFFDSPFYGLFSDVILPSGLGQYGCGRLNSYHNYSFYYIAMHLIVMATIYPNLLWRSSHLYDLKHYPPYIKHKKTIEQLNLTKLKKINDEITLKTEL